MTNIRITSKQNVYILNEEGHAEFNPGNDIVCSAISALTYTLVCGARNIEGVKFITERLLPGDVRVVMTTKTESAMKALDVLFDTFTCGFLMLEKSYPKNVHVEGEK
jgi:uncharacterized protein YsxB (DUF464 family)